MPREGVFRRFELTISVFLPYEAPLPKTFADWIERAFGIDQNTLGASPTQLERVIETRYPLSEDVAEKRRGLHRPWA